MGMRRLAASFPSPMKAGNAWVPLSCPSMTAHGCCLLVRCRMAHHVIGPPQVMTVATSLTMQTSRGSKTWHASFRARSRCQETTTIRPRGTHHWRTMPTTVYTPWPTVYAQSGVRIRKPSISEATLTLLPRHVRVLRVIRPHHLSPLVNMCLVSEHGCPLLSPVSHTWSASG